MLKLNIPFRRSPEGLGCSETYFSAVGLKAPIVVRGKFPLLK